VILSMQDEPAYARKAFELGAQGYVVKDAADDELVGAMDAVLADRIYVHPSLAASLVLGEPQDDPTDREREVLRRLSTLADLVRYALERKIVGLGPL
jgi:two-component system response regulator NreC